MAPAASKFHRLPFNCYELGHTWNPSCTKAAVGIAYHCFKESFKIYTSCYVVSLLASKRYPNSREEVLKILKDVVRSSTFLGVNGFGFVVAFCLLRKVFGHFNFFSVGYLPAFLGSYAAILIEKPHRRSALALYVTNVAFETIFRMLRARGIVQNIKHFDLVLFIISTTTLLYQMKKSNNKEIDAVNTVLKTIIGREEFTRKEVSTQEEVLIAPELEAERNEAIMGQREVNNVGPGLVIGGPAMEVNENGQVVQNPQPNRKRDESYRARFIRFVLWMHRQVEDIACHLERMVAAVYEGRLHDTCPHRKPCFDYWIEGFLSRFGAGIGIQLLINIFMFIRSLLLSRSSKKLPLLKRPSIISYNCIKTGAGFSSICLSFRLLSCAFRWLLGNEDPIHAVAAGVMTSAFGFALLRPPPTIALYVFFKALESVVREAHEENNYRFITWFDSAYGGGWSLLFAISTSVLFHAGILEPQNLKPSYYQFLCKVTGKKFHEINRHLTTVYGTSSNSLMKDFWPTLDKKRITPYMKKLLEDRETYGKGNEMIKELRLTAISKRK